jgi:hypothetical protein
MTIELDHCKEYIHCILIFVRLYKPGLHNIVNYNVTKSNQYCIKLRAHHDG